MKRLLLIICCLMSAPQHLYAENFQDSFNHATELFKNGNYSGATAEYQKTVSINPQCQQAFFNLGLIMIQEDKFDKAIEYLKQALEIDPEYTKAHLYLGMSYQKKEQYAAAQEEFATVLKAQPNNYDAIVNTARCYVAQNKFDNAIPLYKKAIGFNHQDRSVLLEFANTLNMNNNTDEALAMYKNLAQQTPNNPSVLYNIAYTLKKLGRLEEAFPYYQKVLTLDPNHSEAHFSLGLAYLITGDFEHGWPEYEWRWKRSHQMERRNLTKPQWDGQDIRGKTILLHAEQGLGDTLQFVRYGRMLSEMGATVVAAVQPALVTLLRECPYLQTVVNMFGQLPAHDIQIPMLSVPLVVKTTMQTVPSTVPYLYAKPELVEYWKEKLSHDKNFKVGICWQGNSNYSTQFLRTVVAAKSIKLARLAPLFGVPGVSIYNLQKITGEDQLTQLPATIQLKTFEGDFDDSHGRFMDTAAVMKNLDLVISVDTSTAHLAGGLGVPVWIFMPEPCDWRWLLKRTDTPWYPNMRLFRQPTPGDWDSTIATVAQELALAANNKNNANGLHSVNPYQELIPMIQLDTF